MFYVIKKKKKRNQTNEYEGILFVFYILSHSLLEATVTTLNGAPLFSMYCCILFKKNKMKQTLGEFFESEVGSHFDKS